MFSNCSDVLIVFGVWLRYFWRQPRKTTGGAQLQVTDFEISIGKVVEKRTWQFREKNTWKVFTNFCRKIPKNSEVRFWIFGIPQKSPQTKIFMKLMLPIAKLVKIAKRTATSFCQNIRSLGNSRRRFRRRGSSPALGARARRR